jgi:hypothetical protein
MILIGHFLFSLIGYAAQIATIRVRSRKGYPISLLTDSDLTHTKESIFLTFLKQAQSLENFVRLR